MITVPDAVLADLSARLAAARLPAADHDDDWADGTSPEYLRDIIGYWLEHFDWRTQEAALNKFSHFRATVDDTSLHFIHERGRGPAPLPILLLHGYPDSFYRFVKLIPLLTDPAACGGDSSDAFDVIVPSLPGYGFSEPRTRAGGAFGFGDVLHNLMVGTLGYERYAAHGGDWGGVVTELLARSHATYLAGIHLTDVPFFHIFQKPDDLSTAENAFFDKIEKWQHDEGAYALIQSTRPRTASPALNDSPAGLAAWIVEKFQRGRDCGGDIEKRFTKDELLTNIMIYWTTQTIETSFQPYRDFMKAGAARWTIETVRGWIGSDATPAAFARFPADISQPPREWAERFFNVQRWTEMSTGGHFAAFEEPEMLAADIRSFFRPCGSDTGKHTACRNDMTTLSAGPESGSPRSVWDGKPAGIVSVTPYQLGAFDANHAIRQTLVFLNMPAMQQPEAYIGGAGELFDKDGSLKSDDTRKFLAKFMASLSHWVTTLVATAPTSAFDQFISRRHAVAAAYSNGDAAALDAIVAREGEATFFPPNGGCVSGVDEVSTRYDRDAKSFSRGSKTKLDIFQSSASGELGFWTGFQDFEGKIGGRELKMRLRITELFRLAGGEWKLIHRHADPSAEPNQHGRSPTPVDHRPSKASQLTDSH